MPGAFLADLVGYIVAVDTVLIAFIGGYFMLKSKKNEKREKQNEEAEKERQTMLDKRAELRQTESLLTMEMISANIALGIATAYAVKNQDINGPLDTALRSAEKAHYGYNQFVRASAVSNISVVADVGG